MFNKTNKEKIEGLIKRLSNREQNAISDIQKEIQTLRAEEKELEERFADIQEAYDLYLQSIDTHMDRWAELQDLKTNVIVTITN